MSIARLLTQTATVTRTPSSTADSEGNWAPGTQTATTYACRLQDGESIETFEGANRIVADALLFLPASASINGRDEVTVDAKRYQVVGRPAEMRTPRGIHHIEARLQRVDRG